jgi:hypothetical protein
LPDLFKESAAWLKRVEGEYSSLRSLLIDILESPDLGVARKRSYEEILSASELTYMLRLFAAFESGLTLIGPALSSPRSFSDRENLGTKLDQIASAMSLEQTFRDTLNRDLRDLRNELMHGRSLVPRLSFALVYDLMRAFRRGCH